MRPHPKFKSDDESIFSNTGSGSTVSNNRSALNNVTPAFKPKANLPSSDVCNVYEKSP